MRNLSTREIERLIARQFVAHAIARGWKVSVNNGGDWVVACSTDAGTILGAMFTADYDRLLVRDADSDKVGTALFIYGNDGYDVIADHSVNNTKFDSMMAEVFAYAVKFENDREDTDTDCGMVEDEGQEREAINDRNAQQQ